MIKSAWEKQRPHLLPVLLLLIVTFAVYARCFDHDFLVNWDDDKYITAYAAVRGVTFEHLKMAFSTFYLGNYAPVHIVSYMMDYELWGMRAAGFIFANIFLHALNGLLFYGILVQLTGRRLWAFTAGFIFLLHPVQVESVAWLSQRKNLLSMLFFLLAFWLYTLYRHRLRERRLAYSLSLAAFLLALLAKSAAIVLPVALILYDFSFVEKGKRKWFLADKLPYLVVAAFFALLTFLSHAPELSGGRRMYHGGNPLVTFFTMLPVLARYLALLFWPEGLSAIYEPPLKYRLDGEVALSALLLALLIAAGFCLYRRRRDLFFWFSLFFLGLIPVSQIVPIVTLMNDRYLYFPMLGAAALAGWLLTRMVDAAGERFKWGTVFLIAFIVSPLPVLSWEREAVWKDSVALWTDATLKTPDSIYARESLVEALYLKGERLQKTGKPGDALLFYLKALSIDPLYHDALNNAGVLLMDMGKVAQARPYLLRLTGTFKLSYGGFINLGNNYYMSREFEKAGYAYRRALELRPGAAQPLVSLGNVYMEIKKHGKALEYYQKAVEAGASDPLVEYNLACLEALRARRMEAFKHLEKAVALGYGDIENMRKDHDLDSLRKAPRFQSIMDRYRERNETVPQKGAP